MELPANVLLLKINPKSLYLDKKSKELSTGKIKRKYKLAGNMILDEYFFNFLTRQSSACIRRFTLCIEPKDWENETTESRLGGQNSYCDVSKFELINKNDLLAKIRDKGNGFPFIARLCEEKVNELQVLRNEIGKCAFISSETRNLIQKGISPMVKEALIKLGLD